MTMQTLTGTPTLPRVNLLPPEIAEAKRMRRVQAGLGAAVAVSVLAVVGLYYNAHSGVGAAQDQVAQAQADNTRLQQQLTQYQNVTALKDRVSEAETNLQQAMGPQVLWSHVFSDLSLTLPGNVWMTELQAQLGTSDGTSAPGGITGALPSADAIGAISLKGSALGHRDVAAMLSSLAKEKGFKDPFFTKASEAVVQNTTKKVDEFEMTTNLTSKALSGRYLTPLAGE
jgi:Tfp pilus assembly protein PilN